MAAEGILVRLARGLLGVGLQAYLQVGAAPVSDQDWSDAHLAIALADSWSDEPDFGRRLLATKSAASLPVTRT